MQQLHIKKKILIFSIFLIISFILWLLDSLNQTYKTIISIPVNFKDLPKNKVLITDLPPFLNLFVEGYGYDLLYYKFKSYIKPIKINLSKLNIYQINPKDTNKLFILTNEAEGQIASQLKSQIKILDIRPDTIYMEFTKMVSKQLDVKAVIKISFAKQYINKSPPQIIPDQVTAFGPKFILDTLQYIKTQPIELVNISQNIEKEVSLVIPKKIRVQPEKVKFILEVEQYTEVKISVPLKIINLPPNYDIKIFPNKITVRYLVGFSNYNKIHPENFVAVVDYKDLKINPGDKLPVHILHVPQGIYSYSYVPHVVDYIIEEK